MVIADFHDYCTITINWKLNYLRYLNLHQLMLTKHALLSCSYGDDSKMALFVKIGPQGAEFLALRTDRDSRLLI